MKKVQTAEKGTFGIVMSHYREKYDLQQSAVYQGICSPAAYSKAEFDEQNMDFVLIEAMLARVGKEAGDFELMMSDEDYALWMKRLEIWSDMAGRERGLIREKVVEYRHRTEKPAVGYDEDKMPSNVRLHEQFCRYFEMKTTEWAGGTGDEIGKMAWSALSLTKRKEEVPHRKRNLYSRMEMDLLLTLIRYQYGEWRDYHKAEDCLEGILQTMEICTPSQIWVSLEGMVWVELLTLMEQYESAKKLAVYLEKAITYFSKSEGIKGLGEVRFIRARLLWRTRGEAKEGEDRLRACIEECRMAHSLFSMLGQEQKREEVEAFCQEEMEWQYTI